MSQCRACGKEILFIRTIAGNSMPCDAEPIRFRMVSHFEKEKKENFVTPDGRVCRGVRDPEGTELGYRSHWASCTKPEEFRERDQR